MPRQPIAQTRTPSRTGNSVSLTVPPQYAREHGFVDEDGEVTDKQVIPKVGENGELVYVPVELEADRLTGD